MKRIGVVGGLSAESTTHFYSALTHEYIDRFGDANYPEIVLFSVRFQKFMDLSNSGKWQAFADGILEALNVLKLANVDFAVIAANMPHVVFDQVQSTANLPLEHIADAVAADAKRANYERVALLGTVQTMRATFYQSRLAAVGMDCLVPTDDEQHVIQGFLERELFLGIASTEATQAFVHIVTSLKRRGAQAVILGCTEIPLILDNLNSPLPVLDSMQILVRHTLDVALV